MIYPGAVLGGDGQIRGNDFTEGRLEIGEDCVLREMVSMNVGSRKGGGLTRVGAKGYFMTGSHVGHDCRVGDGVTFANSVALGGHVTIGDGVIFGGLSAVQQFCRVGKGAMVGGITGINRDVIPYAMAFGDHAELAGLNLIGLKRRGLPRDTINAMRGTFRQVFYGRDGSVESRRPRGAARPLEVKEVGRDRRLHPRRCQTAPLSRAAARGGAGMTGKLGIIAGGGDPPRRRVHVKAKASPCCAAR